MIQGFNTDRVTDSLNFNVALLANNDEEYFHIPTHVNVKHSLFEVLNNTVSLMSQYEADVAEYEYAEEYQSCAFLTKNTEIHEMEKARILLSANNLSEFSNIDERATDIKYYFVDFYDENHNKLVAVRRASQFKALLGKPVFSMIDNALRMREDTSFKLDNDFDFLITSQSIYIYRPAGFESILDIDDQILSRASEKTQELATRVEYIDFMSLSEYVINHKRAAKYIASIYEKQNVAAYRRDKIVSFAQHSQIPLIDENGRLRPEAGYELDFLKLLDKRIYEIDFTDNDPEIYEAKRRALHQ